MNRITKSTARFRPLLSIPKYASGGIGRLSLEKQAAESVASGEEYEYDQSHDQRDGADHREHRRAVLVHLTEPSARSRRTIGVSDSFSSREEIADQIDRSRREHRAAALTSPALRLRQRARGSRLARDGVEAELARVGLQSRGRQRTAAGRAR
jgi:hypothetical protein